MKGAGHCMRGGTVESSIQTITKDALNNLNNFLASLRNIQQLQNAVDEYIEFGIDIRPIYQRYSQNPNTFRDYLRSNFTFFNNWVKLFIRDLRKGNIKSLTIKQEPQSKKVDKSFALVGDIRVRNVFPKKRIDRITDRLEEQIRAEINNPFVLNVVLFIVSYLNVKLSDPNFLKKVADLDRMENIPEEDEEDDEDNEEDDDDDTQPDPEPDTGLLEPMQDATLV